MKIVYTPTENPEARETWDVDENDLFVGECKVLEKVLGATMMEIGELVQRGSFTAMLAFIWVLRKRSNPTLRLNDMDNVIRVSELSVDEDDDAETEDDPEGPKEEPAEDVEDPSTDEA